MTKALWVILGVLALTCSRRAAVEEVPAERAFYYWRTTFALSPAERRALSELRVNKLYVRAFDVDMRGQTPMLSGVLTLAEDNKLPSGVEVVPVVFLRNSVFVELADAKVSPLAQQVWDELQRVMGRLHLAPHEVQLDCDWNDSTRTQFFAFAEALRAVAPKTLTWSATIRLHQVKFRERTGVPPVDRGMLMFYNMGQFSAERGAHAIFDADAAQLYLERLSSYPLPLDAALPIWSWTIHVRDGRVEGLMQSTDPAELTHLDFLRATEEGRYAVTRTTFLNGNLLREGDTLKPEVTGPEKTQAAAALLSAHLPGAVRPDSRRSSRTVSLFDLSERNLERHGQSNLERVFESIR